MFRIATTSPRLAGALMLAALGTATICGGAQAQHVRDAHAAPGGMRAMGEPMRAPHGYARIVRPPEVAHRPAGLNREVYRHNFSAAERYRIGPYHPPRGFAYRRYVFGERLPRVYWAPGYFLSDYWLFGLDLPPAGYEWVRYGPDALLIDLSDGEVVQTVYGLFL